MQQPIPLLWLYHCQSLDTDIDIYILLGLDLDLSFV